MIRQIDTIIKIPDHPNITFQK